MTILRVTRREFVAGLGSAAAWPLVARAQQLRVPVLGFLASASEASYSTTIAAVRRGLDEAGYVEKQNLLIEYRWANFQYETLPALAAELAKRPVDAIFATGSVVSAIAAKSATANIPIVFVNGSDPVQYGLVASLNRPGGNVTGITFINSQLGPKRIQLLRLLNPKTAIIAVLVNPKNPNAADAKNFDAAGRAVGVEIVIVNASTEPELKGAFNRAVEQRADAMLVHVDTLFNDGGGESAIVALAAQHRMPTMMATGTFPARGGLNSYGPDTRDLNRQAGVYVARILRGEKPADLPVVQPTNFALRINLKTAKTLGLSIPESVLLLADEVIEMKRREFIAALGGAAAWPLIARAQQASKVYRLGYLAPAPIPHLRDALFEALGELGYLEGKNLKVEYRYGAGEALDALAAELVGLKPDLIVTVATSQALAAKQATTTIPVVMATAGDPLRFRVVTSLARPGGNVTGVTLYATELSAKRIELFREAVPRIKRLACLDNAKNPYGQILWQETEPAARALGLEPMLFQMQQLGDLPATFREMEGKDANALIVFSDALFNSARRQIVALAAEHRLPAMYAGREFVEDGGLISYGPNIVEMTRRSAAFVDKILKGANPADLPIEQPTRFELAINAKSAKALGLTLSPILLARADEVIE